MKTKGKILLAGLALLTLTILTAEAQRPGPRGGKGGGYGYGYPDSCRTQLMVDDMRMALDLSADQVRKIEQIHYAHIEEVKALRGKYNNDCVGERQARWDLRDKMDKEVKAVLTGDQAAKYDEFIDNRRGPHGQGYGRGNGRGCRGC